MRLSCWKRIIERRKTVVHLHCHSEYSLLDGLIPIARGELSIRGFEVGLQTLAQRAKELGMPAVALTDHGRVGGWLRHVHEAKTLGLKPIVGVELYVAEDLEQREKEKRFDYDHLVVLARNWQGLVRLFRLTTLGFEKGFYQKPRVDEKAILAEASDDLIILSGCVSSRLSKLALGGKRREAVDFAGRMMNAFGGNFFVELQPHDFPLQREHNLAALDVARESGARIVATNDAHYLRREDWETHQAILCVGTGSRMSDPGKFAFQGPPSYYLATREEMIHGFRRHTALPEEVVEEALDETAKVARLVDFDLPRFADLNPPVDLPEEWGTKREWIGDLCRQGWDRLASSEKQRRERLYQERARYELDVIERMGFLDYFLTVRELYEEVDRLGILRGPGRGSVGGSLVAYLLGITMVDPIEHDLSFERFLNPSRTSPPDIDCDFASDRRDEILEWFRRRFGTENVASIGTWGTLKGRAALRDICRVFSVPLDVVDRLSSEIVEGIDEADLTELEEGWPEAAKAVREVEGLVRTAGVHASGLVASPRLREVVPLEMRGQGEEKVLCTALTGKEVEMLGLVKWDVLGLSALSALAITLDAIERDTGNRIDLRNIPLDDPAVYDRLSEGRTAGVFEFDTLGTARECRRMVFEEFEDIVAMGALMRPGPQRSGMAQLYYQRRRGEKEVPSVHPAYDEVTQKTLGLVVFEEQVSALFVKLAGVTPAEADVARRIVAKSQGGDKFEALRGQFVSGAIAAGMDEKRAKLLFDDLKAFSGYSFNRSHSLSYGMLAYWTAWLREKFPAQFWAGLLSGGVSRQKAYGYVHEGKAQGVRFLPPSVSRSGYGYRTERDGDNWAIRVGFAHVLKVGEKAAQEIELSQPFDSFDDFLARVDRRRVSKGVIEALTKAGALEDFEPNSRALLEDLDELLKKRKKKTASRQASLFLETGREEGKKKAFGEVEREVVRFSVLPLPVVYDPLDFYRETLEKFPATIRPAAEILERTDGAELVTVVGVVTTKESKKGASGFASKRLELHDGTGHLRAVLDARFNDLFEECEGKVIAIQGEARFDAGMIWAQRAVLLERLQRILDGGGYLERDMAVWVEPAVSRVAQDGKTFLPVDEVSGTGPWRCVARVAEVRRFTSKKGRRMTIATLDGRSEYRTLFLSEEDWRNYREELYEGAEVLMRCRGGSKPWYVQLRNSGGSGGDWIESRNGLKVPT